MTEENKDTAFTPSAKEAPFYYEGMSYEEYDIEREYYFENFEKKVKSGKYVPLWKQKEKGFTFYENF